MKLQTSGPSVSYSAHVAMENMLHACSVTVHWQYTLVKHYDLTKSIIFFDIQYTSMKNYWVDLYAGNKTYKTLLLIPVYIELYDLLDLNDFNLIKDADIYLAILQMVTLSTP